MSECEYKLFFRRSCDSRVNLLTCEYADGGLELNNILPLGMIQTGLINVNFFNTLFLSVYKLHYLNDKQKIVISIYIYYTIFPDYFIHNTTNVCSLRENVNNFFNKRGCRLYYSQPPPKSLQLK